MSAPMGGGPAGLAAQERDRRLDCRFRPAAWPAAAGWDPAVWSGHLFSGTHRSKFGDNCRMGLIETCTAALHCGCGCFLPGHPVATRAQPRMNCACCCCNLVGSWRGHDLAKSCRISWMAVAVSVNTWRRPPGHTMQQSRLSARMTSCCEAKHSHRTCQTAAAGQAGGNASGAGSVRADSWHDVRQPRAAAAAACSLRTGCAISAVCRFACWAGLCCCGPFLGSTGCAWSRGPLFGGAGCCLVLRLRQVLTN